MTASILFFSIAGGRVVAHEILIGLFIPITNPVGFMLLVRAALHRDRFEKKADVPAKPSVQDAVDDVSMRGEVAKVTSSANTYFVRNAHPARRSPAPTTM